jgi:putative Mn2+ efflux pump MntP
MNAAATAFLAFAMSADAFAAALATGASLKHPHPLEALRTGAIFGTIETITPVIGWALGFAASSWIADVDHWVAFGLLLVLGLKMIWECFSRDKTAVDERPQRHSFTRLALTGVSTSLDALAVGVTLALIDADIVVAALAIGSCSFVMASLGILIGRAVGARLGKLAEGLGGVLLIAIGTHILLEHLGYIGGNGLF